MKILEYKGYWADVKYSHEDKLFFGKIKEIDDLVLFEGNSIPELQIAFEQAVDRYL